MNEVLIFGAKSIALGVCLALKELYLDCVIHGFIVTSKSGNPDILCGLPVMEAASYKNKEVPVLLAIPPNIQENVRDSLWEMGFKRVICLASDAEAELMRCYYEKMEEFLPLRRDSVEIYMAKSHKDQPLKNPLKMSSWVYPIQAGTALCHKKLEKITDDTGENISLKNANYCELTALYWLWKNRFVKDAGAEYYGFFQYRRILDITEEDIKRLKENHIDAVLPYPMVSEPCIWEHHQRYVKDSDWDAMMQALKELHPDYYEKAGDIFHQKYMYNYNIILAKKDILREYCQWLFPILERTEELSTPRGCERADRYIGYLGENLLTLYFLLNKGRFAIRHTGRIMLV